MKQAVRFIFLCACVCARLFPLNHSFCFCFATSFPPDLSSNSHSRAHTHTHTPTPTRKYPMNAAPRTRAPSHPQMSKNTRVQTIKVTTRTPLLHTAVHTRADILRNAHRPMGHPCHKPQALTPFAPGTGTGLVCCRRLPIPSWPLPL